MRSTIGRIITLEEVNLTLAASHDFIDDSPKETDINLSVIPMIVHTQHIRIQGEEGRLCKIA